MFSKVRLKVMTTFFIIANIMESLSFMVLAILEIMIEIYLTVCVQSTPSNDSSPKEVEQSEEEISEEIYLPYVQVFFDPLIKSLLTAQVSAR